MKLLNKAQSIHRFQSKEVQLQNEQRSIHNSLSQRCSVQLSQSQTAWVSR